MSNSVHAAREALGKRLREMRKDAGLTGRRLAFLAGWHESKVSKIETGDRSPTEADLRAYCAHTGTEAQLPDLVATLRNIEAAYLEWRRTLHTGTGRRQQTSVTLAEQTKITRIFEPVIIPGILQITEYAEAVLRKGVEFYRIPDDVEQGIAKRLERQQFLYRGDHRFHVVIAEQALATTVGNDAIMVAQLDRLLAAMGLPRLRLGIIPARTEFPMQLTNFAMFDDRMVLAEVVTAELRITQPREIALYSKMFAQLAERAHYGAAARELIMAELNSRR
ncbi:helix-turn-helix domain-containing protein [Nocardia blacklockiae]|uniref:helix-turn-helix domain-containing protein n=1 Tax=Nocardia blacklockiae TaxID=480036 RepID=UPI001895C185|nr:helix-turn-helix transcriptional regulator [Nocardia blacklockiae]MBF6175465.1 helix-turn-helix transcriptional regulator [Nocardia blacklockiae]